MKTLGLLLLVLGVIGQSPAQDIHYDWTLSKSQIKQQENQLISEQKQQLIYKDQWTGLQVLKKYKFIKGELARTIIIFRTSHDDKDHYISDFKRINNTLSRKFGKPRSANPRIVINPNLASDRSIGKGEKLSSGAIGFETKWRNSRTTIRHTLRGNTYEIIHVVVFSSTDYGQLADDFQ